MELTNSFEVLLRSFSPVFTEPNLQTFRLLLTGWILSVRHRYVTDLIISSDSVGNGHFSDYHRFFSQAVWDIDHLWKLLATLIVNSLVSKDSTVVLAGDDRLDAALRLLDAAEVNFEFLAETPLAGSACPFASVQTRNLRI